MSEFSFSLVLQSTVVVTVVLVWIVTVGMVVAVVAVDATTTTTTSTTTLSSTLYKNGKVAARAVGDARTGTDISIGREQRKKTTQLRPLLVPQRQAPALPQQQGQVNSQGRVALRQRWGIKKLVQGRKMEETDESQEDYYYDEIPEKGDRDCDDYEHNQSGGNMFGSINPCRDYYGNAYDDSLVNKNPENESSSEEMGVPHGNHFLLTLYVALRPGQASRGSVVTNYISGYLNATNPQFSVSLEDRRRSRRRRSNEEEEGNDEDDSEELPQDDFFLRYYNDDDGANFGSNQQDNSYSRGVTNATKNTTISTTIWELRHLRTSSSLFDAQEKWWWWQYDLLFACFDGYHSNSPLPVTNSTIVQSIANRVYTSVHDGMETGRIYTWMRKTYNETFGALDLTTDPNDFLTFTGGIADSNDGGGGVIPESDNQVFLTVYMAFHPKEPSKRDIITAFLSSYIQDMKPELRMIVNGLPLGGNSTQGQDASVILPSSINGTNDDFDEGVASETKQQQEYGGEGQSWSHQLGTIGGRNEDNGAGHSKRSRFLENGAKTRWDMVHQGTLSLDVFNGHTYWWWEYHLVYSCFWTESQEPITNTTLLTQISADMKQIVADGVASGFIYDWLRQHPSYEAAIEVLNITTNAQDVDKEIGSGSSDPAGGGGSSADEEEDFIYKIPLNEIAEYSTPLDPNEWDWRRYTGLGIFVGTILVTFVLMQVAVCRQRELKKQEVWGHLGTERGVEELLRTGWNLKGNQMEIFDKARHGYDDEQGSIFMGGFEQREAPAEITVTLTHPESETTPESQRFSSFAHHDTECQVTPPQLVVEPTTARKHHSPPPPAQNGGSGAGSEMTPETHHGSSTHLTESDLTPFTVGYCRQQPRKANDKDVLVNVVVADAIEV